VVDVVRELRGVGVNNHRPTIRAAIAIAKMLMYLQGEARLHDRHFVQICLDVLNLDTAKVTRGGQSLMPNKVMEAVAKVCRARQAVPSH
jgi:hypothetical protein